MSEEEITVIHGSGNVFADLDLPDADELLVKTDLVIQISALIKARKLTRDAAARMLGIGRSDCAALLRGQLDDFSFGQLLRFLNALDRDVRIVVAPKPPEHERGQVTVVSASG